MDTLNHKSNRFNCFDLRPFFRAFRHSKGIFFHFCIFLFGLLIFFNGSSSVVFAASLSVGPIDQCQEDFEEAADDTSGTILLNCAVPCRSPANCPRGTTVTVIENPPDDISDIGLHQLENLFEGMCGNLQVILGLRLASQFSDTGVKPDTIAWSIDFAGVGDGSGLNSVTFSKDGPTNFLNIVVKPNVDSGGEVFAGSVIVKALGEFTEMYAPVISRFLSFSDLGDVRCTDGCTIPFSIPVGSYECASFPVDGPGISVNSVNGDFEKTVRVSLVAKPEEGFSFDKWSGDASGTDETIEITMDSDKTVIANFKSGTKSTPIPGLTATPVSTPTLTPEPGTTPTQIPVSTATPIPTPTKNPTIETTSGKTNRSYNKSYEVIGEPVSTNSGAYFFDMSLLELGGLMPLGFTLHYRSDEDNTISRNPNDFPARDLATRFWWNPRSRAKIETGFTTFWLEDGTMVAFKKENDQWLLNEEAQPGQSINGQAERYVMKETDDFIYLMSPLQETLYIYEKSDSDAANGRVVRIMDRNNNQLIYTYADAEHNNPSMISDGLGRELNFTYTTPEGSEESLTKITDHAGRSITFNYEIAADNDNLWSLRSVTDAMGQTTSFEYQTVVNNESTFTDNISKKTLPGGNSPFTQVYGFYAVGDTGAVRVDSQTDAFGNTIDLNWATDASKLTENRPDGSEVIHEYRDHHSQPKNWSDGQGNAVNFEVNEQEQITAVTNRLGDTTFFTYHAQSGKIASITNARGNTLSNTYTSQEQTFTNSENSEEITFTFFNLTRIDFADNTNQQFTYDVRGNLTEFKDRAGKSSTFTYNTSGQVITITNPTEGVITNSYNEDGTLASTMDSDTDETKFGYDEFKRLNKITNTDSTTVLITYDLNDRIVSITDENNNTFNYTYDNNGNLEKIADPTGKETVFIYDLMDRLIRSDDRLGKTTTFGYDSMSRLSSFTEPSGNAIDFSYNLRGWLEGLSMGGQTTKVGHDNERIITSITTPLGHKTSLKLDKLGLTTGITNSFDQTTVFERDSMNRITSIIDPILRTTNFNYDDRGLLSAVSMPVIGKASYERNDLGLLNSINDLNANTWSFSYTPMGRVSSIFDPLGNTLQHTYDKLGRPERTTFADNSTLDRTYDNARNLTRMLFSDNTDLMFTFDKLDRLITANNIALSKDAENRVIETDNSGTVFGSSYDDAGRISSVIYNNNSFTVTYIYDPSTGLLTRVTDDLTNTQLDFDYDNDFRLIGITRSNGVNTTITYDNTDRIERLLEGDIIDIKYTRDSSGQVTGADMITPIDPGNELVVKTEELTFDQSSQVSSTGFIYDNLGRLVASSENSFEWDNASRLTRINDTALIYNGLNDIITRKEGEETTHYFYNYSIDFAPVMTEKDDASGQFLRFYVWSPNGRLLYMIDAENNNKVHFYHFDITGSTLAITDPSGEVTDSYAYTPYGRLIKHEGNSNQPFTYVGMWGIRQEGTVNGLYHMRARYYDATTARFISRDPIWPTNISDLRQLNPYQYAINNPIIHIDKTGEDPSTNSIPTDTLLLGLKTELGTEVDVKPHTGKHESIEKIARRVIDQVKRITGKIGGEDVTIKLPKAVGNPKSDYRIVTISHAQILLERKLEKAIKKARGNLGRLDLRVEVIERFLDFYKRRLRKRIGVEKRTENELNEIEFIIASVVNRGSKVNKLFLSILDKREEANNIAAKLRRAAEAKISILNAKLNLLEEKQIRAKKEVERLLSK